MRKHLLAMPALVALLAGSAVGVTAQDEAGPARLVTEQVEPGVERIIRDDAGHDLDERHPRNRYDMDTISIKPDGTIWLSSTYNGSDNAANPEGSLVWALGQPGTYTLRDGIPPWSPTTYLYVRPDGTKVVTAYEVVSSEDGSFIPNFGPVGLRSRSEDQQAVLVAFSDGEHSCRNIGIGVMCEDASGVETTYLAGTPINQIAAAPDGIVWAVGGYDGDNGGLYRITLE